MKVGEQMKKGGNYTFSAYGKTFTITNADKITIA